MIHQIRGGSSQILLVDLLTLNLVWTLKPSELTSLNHDDRYYLHCDFDLVWLSDSKGVIFLSLTSGKQIGNLVYPSFEKVIPEICWLDEDSSPYAQTGNSVWEIGSYIATKCIRNQKQQQPFIVIVHDIERCNPVAADILVTCNN